MADPSKEMLLYHYQTFNMPVEQHDIDRWEQDLVEKRACGRDMVRYVPCLTKVLALVKQTSTQGPTGSHWLTHIRALGTACLVHVV
jgi:hypothetical protein